MKQKELIGCIADDFTGAADVCSHLVKDGARCILVNDIPTKLQNLDVDVIVIALKIRNIKKEKVLKKVEKAVNFFEKLGVTKIFDKYCSTFDSTEQGNIGPILDYLIDRYDQKFSIISPALPENNREVFNGYLFADKKLLSDSSMANHPLNPMKDSNISRLMNAQSKYITYSLNYRLIEAGEDAIKWFSDSIESKDKYYIVTDYFKEEHGKNIIKSFGDLRVLSGSSVFISDWYNYLFNNKEREEKDKYSKDNGKAALFCGSFSDQSTNQIEEFIDRGGYAVEVNADFINESYIEKNKKLLLENEDNILFYSSRDKENDKNKLKNNAKKLEEFFAIMSKFAYDNGIRKIIVAGGETSGSVINALPFSFYRATDIVSTGIPVLRPLENTRIQIVLKSGNFGEKDFFNRAIEILEN